MGMFMPAIKSSGRVRLDRKCMYGCFYKNIILTINNLSEGPEYLLQSSYTLTIPQESLGLSIIRYLEMAHIILATYIPYSHYIFLSA
ncbi:hypothetical protein EXIGUO8H_20650 [Exiguobacterium sp. 8H]|nr:hypothetical protein EXIGUO8H_20650 [Exiguobacterium sp. 8H]